MLSCDGVSHTEAGRPILSDLALSVAPGEVVGLIGLHGSGKSAALNIIVGRLRPNHGTVRLDGKEINSLPLWVRSRRGIAYLPEGPALIGGLTVEENLLVAARAMPNAKEAVRTVMDDLSLASLAAVKASALGIRERRTVEVARVFVLAPKVVVMDEPFSGLDEAAIDFIKGTIRELARRGVGVLVADPVGHSVVPVCDRVVILESGRVVVEGCAEVIWNSPDVRKRFPDVSNDRSKGSD